jgi:hypothetical protein
MFVRFVVTEREKRSDQPMGVFTALYALERNGQLAPHELAWFHQTEEWFDERLTRPDRLTRSSKPGARSLAITWLKASAVEHITRMRELVALLEYKDIAVEEQVTSKPGYVVYEDEYQVAAIPFGDETYSS